MLELDSFGGWVDAAFEIVDSIVAVEHATTVGYVKSKAISAAALIALACDRLYMADHSTLGDCAPIVQTYTGPKEVGEKYQSPLRAKFRSLAKRNGYPVALAEAMVTKDMLVYAVTTADSTFYADERDYARMRDSLLDTSATASPVVEGGELLTMDNEEALKLGFSRGTVESIEQIAADMGVTEFTVRRLPDRSKGGMWASMSGFEKMYWFIAVPASVFFLLMAALTFMGIGGGEMADGMDTEIDADTADFDHPVDHPTDTHAGDGDGSFADAFHFFTVRNFMVFFVMFGWSGIALVRSGVSVPITILVSTVIGLVMMSVVSFMFWGISRLVHSGNVGIRSAVGATGTVYLKIPEKKSGSGKVTVLVEGKQIEYQAMTEGKALATGESITVCGLVGNGMVLVAKN